MHGSNSRVTNPPANGEPRRAKVSLEKVSNSRNYALSRKGADRERERGVVNPAAGERRWIESSSTAVKRHVV